MPFRRIEIRVGDSILFDKIRVCLGTFETGGTFSADFHTGDIGDFGDIGDIGVFGDFVIRENKLFFTILSKTADFPEEKPAVDGINQSLFLKYPHYFSDPQYH